MINMDINGNKIGPSETVILKQRFYSCFGCKYFHIKVEFTMWSPEFEDRQVDIFCKKMDYKGDVLGDSEICLNYYRLSSGRLTPNCCPYLKSKIRDDKLNKIL